MLVIKAELIMFEECKHLASLDFCSEYYQYPLHPSLNEASGLVTQQGAFILTLALHGLKDAVPCFQLSIRTSFYSINDGFMTWIDSFIQRARSEDKLLHQLNEFFGTCARYNLIQSVKTCGSYSIMVKV